MYMFHTKEKATVYKLISWQVQCSKQFVLVGSREQIGLTRESAGAFVTQEGNYFEKVRFDVRLFQSHIVTQMLGIIVLFCVKSFQHYPTLGFHSWEKYPTDKQTTYLDPWLQPYVSLTTFDTVSKTTIAETGYMLAETLMHKAEPGHCCWLGKTLSIDSRVVRQEFIIMPIPIISTTSLVNVAWYTHNL